MPLAETPPVPAGVSVGKSIAAPQRTISLHGEGKVARIASKTHADRQAGVDTRDDIQIPRCTAAEKAARNIQALLEEAKARLQRKKLELQHTLLRSGSPSPPPARVQLRIGQCTEEQGWTEENRDFLRRLTEEYGRQGHNLLQVLAHKSTFPQVEGAMQMENVHAREELKHVKKTLQNALQSGNSPVTISIPEERAWSWSSKNIEDLCRLLNDYEDIIHIKVIAPEALQSLIRNQMHTRRSAYASRTRTDDIVDHSDLDGPIRQWEMGQEQERRPTIHVKKTVQNEKMPRKSVFTRAAAWGKSLFSRETWNTWLRRQREPAAA